jgi:succinate dehydrogenase / fumarate reductase iron-sulfur subunit
MVNHRAFDEIMQAGAHVNVNARAPQDANEILILKDLPGEVMDAAARVGCGACVACCQKSSAMSFVSERVSQLNLLPHGKVEAHRRAKAMISKMDELGLRNWTNTRVCEAECPKNVSISQIVRLNCSFLAAKLKE